MDDPRPWRRRLASRTPVLGRLLSERDDLRRQLRRSQARARRLHARLGRLQPHGDLQFVFVVTYGRSGSTLLQGILNSIPGWLIRGENGGAVYHLYRHYITVVTRSQSRQGEEPRTSTSAWFGLDGYPRRRALVALRNLVVDTLMRPEADTRVTGFKEIRWGQKDLVDYLRFLQKTFPGARFVFNSRDHAAVVRSQWWGEHPDPQGRLDEVEALHARAREALGTAAYHVHYDDYVADPTVLRGLFEWLGEDFDEDRIHDVLGVRHSY